MPESWFADVLKRARSAYGELKSEKAVDFVFKEIPPDQGGIERRPLEDSKEYFNIKVRSSHIVDVRKWEHKFHGCIHARTIYLHESAGRVEFQSILAPSAMMNLDPGNIDHVIALDLSVLRPVPFRGAFSLELGLFSVKGEDLAAPYINLLSGLAKSAGGSVQQALGIMDPLRKGFDLLFGTTKQSALEIGVQREWTTPETGTWLLMRAPVDEVKVEALTVEADGRLTSKDKSSSRFPYVVLQIEALPKYDDWMTIPELRDAWKAIGDAQRARDADKTIKMMEQFYITLQWSPDLIPDDVARLYAKAQAKLAPPPVQAARLGARPKRSKAAAAPAIAEAGDFQDLGLYDS